MYPPRRSQLAESLRRHAERWAVLAARHGTPLLVLDPYCVAAQYSRLRSALPGFRLHYAVKALPHPAVLATIAVCGGAFDVATRGEVDQLGQAGVPMERCLFTHPIKKPADIDHAYRAGIRTFVVDNAAEAEKFRGRPRDVDVLVRLRFGNPAAKSDLSSKFGVAPADAELLVKNVLAAGVRFAGFSFHVGSQGSTAEPYRAALQTTVDLATQINDTHGIRADVIDIGGGFPVSYREPMPSIESIGAIVDDVLGVRRREFTLLAEPGRYLVADCMTLLTTVVGTAVRDGQVWHYLDDGLFGSYSNVMTEDVHPPILAMRELVGGPDSSGELEPVTLAGPTCDSADVIARGYPMPTLDIGDVVVSPVMGAYTAVTSSRFNGIPATPIVLSRRSENTSVSHDVDEPPTNTVRTFQ